MSKLTNAFAPEPTLEPKPDNTYTPDYSLSTGIIRNNDLRGQVGGSYNQSHNKRQERLSRQEAHRKAQGK